MTSGSKAMVTEVNSSAYDSGPSGKSHVLGCSDTMRLSLWQVEQSVPSDLHPYLSHTKQPWRRPLSGHNSAAPSPSHAGSWTQRSAEPQRLLKCLRPPLRASPHFSLPPPDLGLPVGAWVTGHAGCFQETEPKPLPSYRTLLKPESQPP